MIRAARPQRSGRGPWLACLALCSVLLGSCAPAPAGRELTFWTIGREGEAIMQLLPAFERAHPGITVKVQQLPLTAAHQKLLTAFAGGSTPDLSQLGNTWLPELVALHALEPLQARVDHSGVVRADDYFASIWATNVIDGTLYGVPWYVDTRLLFYRKDLLKAAGFGAPPRTWAEWRSQLAALSDPSQHRYGILMPTN
jgi:multiple sugar transport system substrate-binding protein